MGIELFLNDYYDLVKLLYDSEAEVNGEKIIPLTQQDLAVALNCSKMKISSMFIVLQREKFIRLKTRNTYILTDDAKKIIEMIEPIKAYERKFD